MLALGTSPMNCVHKGKTMEHYKQLALFVTLTQVNLGEGFGWAEPAIIVKH